ncbi:MAG TPA: glycosyltransferase family 10 [Candidatus Pacearchaeota archaeon]|nr:glycosyltransferase family 10 [Candidatus Pacearchaeota archaeon]
MKKPEIKINFLYYGTPFDLNKNFFYKLLNKKYKVIISDKPDYVFFSVYRENNKFLNGDGTSRINKGSKNKKVNFIKKIILKLMKFNKIKSFIWFLREKKIIRPYARILDVKGNFVKIFYTSEIIKPDMSKCDWAFGPFYESDLNNHPKYMRIPPYIISGSNFDLIKRKLDLNKIKKEKIKFCNFLYNNPVPIRNKFFKRLSKYKHIDSPGRSMNNMPPIGNYKDSDESRGSKDWMNEKLSFISKYKFTIAFENSFVSGWITEKLIDPMLINSIPIYFGPKDIGKEFNTKSFINFNDFKNVNDFISYIIRVDKDDFLYEKILKEPWLKENKKSIWMDEIRILKRMKEIFEK